RHSQPAQEPYGGFNKLRRRARLASPEPPAGLLPDEYRARGPGGQAEYGPAGVLRQEPGSDAARRGLSRADQERGGADRLAETIASAWSRRFRDGKARARHGDEHLGRGRPQ